MQATIKPGFLAGTLSVPASKSMMQRACAGALLHRGRTIIHNPGRSEDDLAALHIVQQLGGRVVEQSATRIVIESSGMIPEASAIYCGESGLSARLFTPIASLCNQQILIDGHGSLLRRPMQIFQDVLPQLGVTMIEFHGHLPFAVRGPLSPLNISVDGSVSSQFLSGLLFAYCAAATQPVVITVHNLKSKPYIDLTLQVLAAFGWVVTHDGYRIFFIDPALFDVKSDVEINIEGDWSSAAYWLVGAALNGSVSLLHHPLNSFQADRKIIELLKDAGCEVVIEASSISVKQTTLSAFDADLNDAPDLFPIVAILAACSHGTTVLRGLHRLQHKESDRKHSTVEMLQRFGVHCRVDHDALLIDGPTKLNATTIHGYHDHRIVMAAAIGALSAEGNSIITSAEAVAKSYPNFFEHLASLGIQCLINS